MTLPREPTAPAHVLISTDLTFMERPPGEGRVAILREHPRHDRQHAPREAPPAHGGRLRARPREARDVQPRREREGPHWTEDDRGGGGVRAPEDGGDDHRTHEREHGHGAWADRRHQGGW